MEKLQCFRCKCDISGEVKIVNGKFLGPSCYEKYQTRNRIRAQFPSKEQTLPGLIQTDICETDCIECQFFLNNKCPLEDRFKGILGRRR